MDITNSTGGDITITRLYVIWPDIPFTQSLDSVSLLGNLIWNQNDNDSPSDFPNEGNWINGSNRTMSATPTQLFVLKFREPLQPTGYEVHIVFDIACQIVGTK
jgi:hypothetical protein